MPRFGGLPRVESARPDDASGRVDRACRLAVAGKLALRDIAAWVEGIGVSETEFRLLWLLFQQEHGEESNSTTLDQADLAERLAVSAAQVSGVIERLRQRELVDRVPDVSDRRRQLWRLASPGEILVQTVIANVANSPMAASRKGAVRQEDAA